MIFILDVVLFLGIKGFLCVCFLEGNVLIVIEVVFCFVIFLFGEILLFLKFWLLNKIVYIKLLVFFVVL